MARMCLIVLVVAAFACTLSKPATNTPSDADAAFAPICKDDCCAACRTFAKFGCPEAQVDGGDGCVGACRHAETTGIVDPHAACVVAAQSLQQVQACGAGTCPK